MVSEVTEGTASKVNVDASENSAVLTRDSLPVFPNWEAKPGMTALMSLTTWLMFWVPGVSGMGVRVPPCSTYRYEGLGITTELRSVLPSMLHSPEPGMATDTSGPPSRA